MSSKGPKGEKRAPGIPRPSASVLLISPNNQVLLLQRVKQSSSFPSAHVFPGGNVSEQHDGRVPDASTDLAAHHADNDVYRRAAIRETFEESGILLARNNGFGRLIEVDMATREAGRRAIHSNQIPFERWLAQQGGRADIDGLVPFTRWVTPPNVPRRFTTQMYLYFLPTLATIPPFESTGNPTNETSADEAAEARIPVPTTDGGIEHTNARFLPAATWCRLAQEGRIIMFPPQFFLLHQVAQFLDGLSSPTAYDSVPSPLDAAIPRTELEARRRRLLDFVKNSQPPWTEMCICPTPLPPSRDGKPREDGRAILGLHRPGPELEAGKVGRSGCFDQCVLVAFGKEGPRRVAVISREEALGGSGAAKM